jgi:hypothetical protein
MPNTPDVTKEYVVDMLRDYKRLIALKNELEYQYDGVLNAQVLSDMPKGSGLSDPIQSALNKIEAEKKQLELDIKRINDWVEYLNEEEKFAITQLYFEERYFGQITNKWATLGKEYYSTEYWKRKVKKAVNKIMNIKKAPVI